MGSFAVRIANIDESLSRVRRVRLTIGSKQIYTPRRALNLKDSNSESKVIRNKAIRGINEIYKVITKQKLDEISSDPHLDAEFGRSLRLLSNPIYGQEFNLLVFSYQNMDKKYNRHYNTIPSTMEIRRLCESILHPSSDVIVPPRISGISGEQYCTFLKSFFEHLKTYSFNQTILGFIPFVARNEIPMLFRFYKENGITSFVVDFEAHNPIDVYATVQLVHNLSQEIAYDYRADIYLHAFNVPFTRIKQRVDVTPAKDIITLMMGFDSFGSSHLPTKLPLDVIHMIREKRKSHSSYGHVSDSNPSDQFEVFRIFNRDDYGYYRSDIPDLHLQDEQDASISIGDIYIENTKKEKRGGIRKGYNVERQGIEAINLQNKINENSLLSYLEEKKYVKNIVRKFANTTYSH